MAYDEALAQRIRSRIGEHPGLSERKMFGGIVFMIGGNMAVGVNDSDLMVRVGKDGHTEAVARPGARVMDFTNRPMKGWVWVAPAGFSDDERLSEWIAQGVAFAEGLPAK